MYLTRWRHSTTFRIASLALLLDFSTFQNLYGQEYAIQEVTHLYTLVQVAGAKQVEKGAIKTSLKVFVAETPQRCGVSATKSNFFRNCP